MSTQNEWRNRFNLSLTETMASAGFAPVTFPTSESGFGRYIVAFVAAGGDEQSLSIMAMEYIDPAAGAAAVDAMNWNPSLDQSPSDVARKVADWLRARS